MTLYSWFRDSVEQNKITWGKSENIQLNQSMWPVAEVRDGLLASTKKPTTTNKDTTRTIKYNQAIENTESLTLKRS
ncbi:hypothetical protein [Thalassotalea euphylliae]|uniref:Uncharacterized protein n=1 Tax=Thalassotalea euphylliae TaxID=1655234 RepID=A0A3E0UIE2_9GAMM|nr:hypothetical protein [Thalassotalea euphylliae]REL35965.1 hypothetical protein DXX92_11850 [Thalassotalea euphylliae]